MSRRILAISVTAILTCGLPLRVLFGCPFCAAVSQTFSEEIASMDAVVIARLLNPPEQSSSTSDPSGEVPKATFQIDQIIKGHSLLKGQSEIETIYFGEAKKGQPFLMMGVDPPNVMWSTPLQLTDRGRDYVSRLMSLPEKGADRLVFFQEYLEDEDEMLARDAYDEFAKAPYSEVKDLKDRMEHERLTEWIKSTDVPASRRRLYLTMLGVCGVDSDLEMLEGMLKSSDRKMKAGLDAMIACYLTLKGPSGMPLIEDLFLKNKKAEYADTYAAIMALRFHGTEADIVPREKLLRGLRFMLERPQLADLVIPDLAKWEDWSVMDQLVNLFKEADEKSSWVRVPVINYLRACPLPQAKEYIAELEEIDPAAVKRARTFFPFGTSGDDNQKSSNWQRPSDKQVVEKSPTAAATSGLIPAVPMEQGEIAAARPVNVATRESIDGTYAVRPRDQAMNPLLILAVTLLAGSGMFGLMWSILSGAGRSRTS